MPVFTVIEISRNYSNIFVIAYYFALNLQIVFEQAFISSEAMRN